MLDENEIGPYLSDGRLRLYIGFDAKVYPLTLHNKIIADEIYDYYKRLCKRDLDLRTWSDWLKEKMIDLMELDENYPHQVFQDIWDVIDNQVKILEENYELYIYKK